VVILVLSHTLIPLPARSSHNSMSVHNFQPGHVEISKERLVFGPWNFVGRETLINVYRVLVSQALEWDVS
jgi:hypothetical protein